MITITIKKRKISLKLINIQSLKKQKSLAFYRAKPCNRFFDGEIDIKKEAIKRGEELPQNSAGSSSHQANHLANFAKNTLPKLLS